MSKIESGKLIVLVGGGSGGHLTPLLSVAEAIKKSDQEVKLLFIGQKGEDLHEVMNSTLIDYSTAISAGKFRRYHGESFISHLFDIKTMALNFRDFFRFLKGLVDAWIILRKYRPQVIFLKGGFVSVPVGFVARFQKIPYITHDSDAIPGLANRLTAKHAKYNLTALPSDLYPYNPSKTKQVGIPLLSTFKHVTDTTSDASKIELGYKKTDKIILSVGGGLGAQKINTALTASAKQILSDDPSINIIHITGKKLFAGTKDLYESHINDEEMKRIKLIDFTTELYKYSEAADIVITRAGATNLAEFGVQAKTCIVVPAPHLTGGQQLHNAEVLKNKNAAIILEESSLIDLPNKVKQLLEMKSDEFKSFGDALQKLTVPDAANKISSILLGM